MGGGVAIYIHPGLEHTTPPSAMLLQEEEVPFELEFIGTSAIKNNNKKFGPFKFDQNFNLVPSTLISFILPIYKFISQRTNLWLKFQPKYMEYKYQK